MTRKDAIEAIKCNWPDSRYTILREALDMAISALRKQDVTDSHEKNEPLTNAQKIRAMTDEELAEFIISIPMCVGEDKDLNCEIDVCKECFLKWLQQPAEEDDYEQ